MRSLIAVLLAVVLSGCVQGEYKEAGGPFTSAGRYETMEICVSSVQRKMQNSGRYVQGRCQKFGSDRGFRFNVERPRAPAPVVTPEQAKQDSVAAARQARQDSVDVLTEANLRRIRQQQAEAQAEVDRRIRFAQQRAEQLQAARRWHRVATDELTMLEMRMAPNCRKGLPMLPEYAGRCEAQRFQREELLAELDRLERVIVGLRPGGSGG